MSQPIELGHGFLAVPYDAVTLNGMYLPHLATETSAREWCVLLPSGRPAMGESGRRPYRYRSIEDCRRDVTVLHDCGVE